MFQGADINITVSWGVGQDNLEVVNKGEVIGRGKFVKWELSLKVIPMHEYVEVVKNEVVGKVTDLIVDEAWGNIRHKDSQAEDLKAAFKGLNIGVPHEPDDCEMEPVDDVYDEDYQMEPVDDGVLPTTPSPPTSQRPPGHPPGEPGGRQHPPQPPDLHDLKSLVMCLLNTKNMLEKSFHKTEKVLDARNFAQHNSGCTIECSEGIKEGHEHAHEDDEEVVSAHDAPDHLN